MPQRPLHIVLQPLFNRATVQGEPLELVHRGEAAFLAELIRGGHDSEDSACSALQMQAALARVGQRGMMHRRQWGRLIDHLCSELDRVSLLLGLDEALGARLGWPHRGKTVGPWWWQPGEGDSLAESDELAAPGPGRGTKAEPAPPSPPEPALPPPAPRLASILADPLDPRVPELCQNYVVGHALRWDGAQQDAHALWSDDSPWRGASPEFELLRRLRQIESLLTLRRYPEVQTLLDQTHARLSRAEPVLQGLFAHPLMICAQRLRYGSQPSGNHQRLLDGGVPDLALQCAGGELNPQPMAERHNLLALCERRWVEENQHSAPAADVHEHMRRSLAHSHAALFYSFFVHNMDLAQMVAANLGYAHTRFMALPGQSAQLEQTLAWYAVSQSCLERFSLPDNSVWESIFLGELWLGHPAARTRLERVDMRSTWKDRHPSRAEFYLTALQRTLDLNDPRQQAYAVINLAGFDALTGQVPPGVTRKAVQALKPLLDADPDLVRLLATEGGLATLIAWGYQPG